MCKVLAKNPLKTVSGAIFSLTSLASQNDTTFTKKFHKKMPIDVKIAHLLRRLSFGHFS